MGLTTFLTPSALLLFVLAVVLLVQGIRRKRTARICAAAAVFLFLAAGYGVIMEFITRV